MNMFLIVYIIRNLVEILRETKPPKGNQQKTEQPAGIYLLKVRNRKTRARCEICSKLTIKTSVQRQWLCSGVFIVNFEHISYLVLVFLLFG